MWLPRFTCPECREAVGATDAGGFACARCALLFPAVDGVFRFLTPGRAAAAEAFVDQYRRVRARDGHRERSAEFYRALPMVRRDDPNAAEWRIRRESYAELQQRVLPLVCESPTRVLDIGAGSGWLSHRLASFGHRVVAVDYLDDEDDGLGVCRLYPVAVTPVQADFDALPFEPMQFDLVVLNASLHYSPDPAATLAEAKRMLAAGGRLVVMDSPMFAADDAGRAMVAAQRETWADAGAAVQPGAGYLTYDALDCAAARLGLHAQFYPSRGPLAWRLQREIGRLRMKRAPAAFGVWVAQ